jgi:hypothetical protein
MAKTFTTFDNGTTTIDRSYTFTVKAKDQFGFSAITRDFTINVTTPNDKLYSTLSVRPYLDIKQRSSLKSFVNDSVIFTPGYIYRPSDPEFGIQQQLKMIIYAGIETKTADEFVSAIGLNHKKKQFKFGQVKKAYAIYPGTNTVVYETVYVEIIDPLEVNNKDLANKIYGRSGDPKTVTVDSSNNFYSRDPNVLNITTDPYGSRPDPKITIDQTNLEVSDTNTHYIFPNSVHSWRSRISAVGDSERKYLPLWMRSIQPGTKQELGFILAVPICYCVPGKADDIVLNIKHSGFDFKTLNYEVDRYIIDAVDGYTSDKYLVFKNNRNTL